MIRIAKVSDSEIIAKLIIKSWQSAYRGLIDDKFLDNLSVKSIKKNWKKNILSQNEEDRIYVYEEKNEIVGVIRFGEPKDRENKKYNAEILVLYVDPTMKRKGIGSKLFDFAKSILITEDKKDLIIWCLKGNNQGISFYEKNGGRARENRKSVVNGLEVEEVGFQFNLY